MTHIRQPLPLAVRLFALLLPIQFAVTAMLAHTHREPWPAMVFPGFASVHHDGHRIQLSEAVFDLIDADGRFLWRIPAHRLDLGLPDSQRSAFGGSRLHSLLEMTGESDAELNSWLSGHLMKQYMAESISGRPTQVRIVVLRLHVDAKGMRIAEEQTRQEFSFQG